MMRKRKRKKKKENEEEKARERSKSDATDLRNKEKYDYETSSKDQGGFAYYTERHGEVEPTFEMKVIGMVGRWVGFFESTVEEEARRVEKQRKEEEHRHRLSERNRERREVNKQSRRDQEVALSEFGVGV